MVGIRPIASHTIAPTFGISPRIARKMPQTVTTQRLRTPVMPIRPTFSA
jgi:hypothetical protein